MKFAFFMLCLIYFCVGPVVGHSELTILVDEDHPPSPRLKVSCPGPLGDPEPLRILDYRNPEDFEILKGKCNPVKNFKDPNFRRSASSLIRTFEALPSGAGLAARQLGLNEDMFVLSPSRNTREWFLFANALLIPIENSGTFETWQGCFSCPLALVKVRFYNKYILRFNTITGRQVTVSVENKFLIGTLCHEKWHNEGGLITDLEAEKRIFETQEEYLAELIKIKEQDRELLGAGEEASRILSELLFEAERSLPEEIAFEVPLGDADVNSPRSRVSRFGTPASKSSSPRGDEDARRTFGRFTSFLGSSSEER
jgi:peptide deformylase